MKHFPMEIGLSTSTLPSFAEQVICAEDGEAWPCREELATRYDWHDSACSYQETQDIEGKPLTLPCDCEMPRLFRLAYESGRSEAFKGVDKHKARVRRAELAAQRLHETHVCRDCGAEITLPYAETPR